MGPTREFLQDNMVLRVTVAGSSATSLDPMTGMVFRCAKELKTVAQTVEAIGLGREITCRMIHELLTQNIIAISGNHTALAQSTPPPKTAPVKTPDPVDDTGNPSNEMSTSYIEELKHLHESCNESNYYEILGIFPETKRTEMRNRYFTLSKRFHPDKAYGKVAPSQKQMMSAVFQKLTEAYDTLSNPRRRKKYDESLGEKLEIWAMEAKLKQAMTVSEKEVGKSPSPPPPSSPPPVSDSPAPSGRIVTTPSPAKDWSPSIPIAQTKSNHASTVHRSPSSPTTHSAGVDTGATDDKQPPSENASAADGPDTNAVGNSQGKSKFVPSVTPNPSAVSRRQIIRRRRAGRAMADILRRRNPSLAPVNNETQRTLIAEAQGAMKKGIYAEAAEYLKKALEIAPNDRNAQRLLETATLEHKKAQAQAHLRRGRYAKSAGELEQALWHYKQALTNDKDSLDARHLIAELFVEQQTNLDRALAYMREIIVLGGQKARYFVTLGDIFLLLKEVDRATDAFNKALTMEPNNKDIKKRFRYCKK